MPQHGLTMPQNERKSDMSFEDKRRLKLFALALVGLLIGIIL